MIHTISDGYHLSIKLISKALHVHILAGFLFLHDLFVCCTPIY